ncbi:hypothetical protein DENSPDRAFT_887007 [Dentipellis sp. KUC8613]|nr:hypothetical protein DENSPDRAFT_887007 [Dentipellis sp. KUC8613]
MAAGNQGMPVGEGRVRQSDLTRRSQGLGKCRTLLVSAAFLQRRRLSGRNTRSLSRAFSCARLHPDGTAAVLTCPQLLLPALSSLARHLLHPVAPCHRPLHHLEPTAALAHLNAALTRPNVALTRPAAALTPQCDTLVPTTTLSRINAAVLCLDAAVSRTLPPSRTCHCPHPLHAALAHPLVPQYRPNAAHAPFTALSCPLPPSHALPPPSHAPGHPPLRPPAPHPCPCSLSRALRVLSRAPPPPSRSHLHAPSSPSLAHARLCAPSLARCRPLAQHAPPPSFRALPRLPPSSLAHRHILVPSLIHRRPLTHQRAPPPPSPPTRAHRRPGSRPPYGSTGDPPADARSTPPPARHAASHPALSHRAGRCQAPSP